MADFLSALQNGINSAVNREANFLEIHTLFFLVKEQMDTFSQGKISTRLKNIPQNPVQGTVNHFENPSKLYDNKRLYVSKTGSIFDLILTDIYFDRDNGYPCTIMIDGDEYTSVNKESLEENIKKLLSSPSTGNILYSLMK